MADAGQDLEQELQQQLEEQQEALGGVRELLAADPGSAETAALLEELEAGIRETEAALMGLKRQRLLLEIDALHSQGGDQQQQQQQQQHPGGAAPTQLPHVQPGSVCVFRHTDGRHYFGRVVSCSSSDSTAQLQWLYPTRQYQLERLSLPLTTLQPAPDEGGSLAPAAGELHAGSRVWAQPRGARLWSAAEVAEVDAAGARVLVVMLADQRRHVLPASSLARAVHAPDPHADPASSGSEGGGGSRATRSRVAPASGYESDGSSGSEGSEDDGSGSDGEGGGSEDEQAEAWGYGRVASALAEAAGLQQAQAAAGPQTQTALFFASEGHSRGIGSKLLAQMGFRGQGRGLGRHQQGMQQALAATRLKKGAGLGVDGGAGIKEGSKKRKRSGKQRRRDKAAAAGFEAREAERSRQAELEARTGSAGLFAVLNSIVGDSSAAQAVKEERLGMGPGAKHAHLFAGSQGGGGGGGKPGQPKQPEDRRALVQRSDELAQLRAKVKQLSEMAGRNARDKTMLPQIKRALGEAQAQLAAAERQHSASTKAIHDREKLKRMAKF